MSLYTYTQKKFEVHTTKFELPKTMHYDIGVTKLTNYTSKNEQTKRFIAGFAINIG